MKSLIVIGLLIVGVVVVGTMMFANSQKSSMAASAQKQQSPTTSPAVKTTSNTIVDIAKNDGNFDTLVKALGEAELVETLSGEGPFTVFAPTDEAFAKIPEETLNALLADKEKLKQVLTYHVVPGKVMAADVVKLHSAKTVQGQEVAIQVVDGVVMVDNAKVTKTDIEADNGVIHVIDTVIMPK